MRRCFALCSLLLGACTPALRSPVSVTTESSRAPDAAPGASLRSASLPRVARPAHLRRVARLAPPFGAPVTARRVNAPERESLPALVTR